MQLAKPVELLPSVGTYIVISGTTKARSQERDTEVSFSSNDMIPES